MDIKLHLRVLIKSLILVLSFIMALIFIAFFTKTACAIIAFSIVYFAVFVHEIHRD